jgi:hypothetical protein
LVLGSLQESTVPLWPSPPSTEGRRGGENGWGEPPGRQRGYDSLKTFRFQEADIILSPIALHPTPKNGSLRAPHLFGGRHNRSKGVPPKATAPKSQWGKKSPSTCTQGQSFLRDNNASSLHEPCPSQPKVLKIRAAKEPLTFSRTIPQPYFRISSEGTKRMPQSAATSFQTGGGRDGGQWSNMIFHRDLNQDPDTTQLCSPAAGHTPHPTAPLSPAEAQLSSCLSVPTAPSPLPNLGGP